MSVAEMKPKHKIHFSFPNTSKYFLQIQTPFECFFFLPIFIASPFMQNYRHEKVLKKELFPLAAIFNRQEIGDILAKINDNTVAMQPTKNENIANFWNIAKELANIAKKFHYQKFSLLLKSGRSGPSFRRI